MLAAGICIGMSGGCTQLAPQPIMLPAPPPRAEVVDIASLERSTLDEVNRVREENGSAPLRIDPGLQRIARDYAHELAERRDLSHVSKTPGKRTIDERVHSVGLSPRDYGENLALLTSSPQAVPRTVVRMWLNSHGHRRNMLDRTFTRTGLGIALGSDHVWYLTQDFATAR
jgi:uncharacterized protein YkwD